MITVFYTSSCSNVNKDGLILLLIEKVYFQMPLIVIIQ